MTFASQVRICFITYMKMASGRFKGRWEINGTVTVVAPSPVSRDPGKAPACPHGSRGGGQSPQVAALAAFHEKEPTCRQAVRIITRHVLLKWHHFQVNVTTAVAAGSLRFVPVSLCVF